MAKTLCFIVILSVCLLTVELTRAEESPSPAISPARDSPLPPESHASPSPPEADSLPPPASSPRPEPLADSPPPPPPQPSSSPSTRPAPVPNPSEDVSNEDSEPETEYFPSPRPSPAPEERKPDDLKASEDGDEFEKEEDSGMSGLEKAGIAIGAILGVGAVVMGAIVYKKRRDNLTRARYTYFQGEFL
ncbi:En/Spm-like transposon protein [Hirschfeldia incana]|nr:En/Spm-like transposon protein [Hirschfeldia incana]